MKTIGTLKLNELESRIQFCVEERINVLLVGFPGIGKSQFTKAIADNRGWGYIHYAPSMGNPTHITGLGMKVERGGETKAQFLFYDFMEKVMGATEKTVVHIEDMIQGTPLMQAAIMSLIEKRMINNIPIPDCISFVIDTNDSNHKAGGAMVIAPLIGRTVVYHFPIDSNGWIKWGISTGRIPKELILYIHANPDDLCANAIPTGMQAINTPRNWERLGKFINAGFTDIQTIAGCVGESIAIKVSAFLSDIAKFGSILAKVKKNPHEAEVYTSVNDTYGVLMILINNFTKDNVSNIVTYVKRYSNDELFNVLFELGCEMHPDSKETREYVQYVSK